MSKNTNQQPTVSELTELDQQFRNNSNVSQEDADRNNPFAAINLVNPTQEELIELIRPVSYAVTANELKVNKKIHHEKEKGVQKILTAKILEAVMKDESFGDFRKEENIDTIRDAIRKLVAEKKFLINARVAHEETSVTPQFEGTGEEPKAEETKEDDTFLITELDKDKEETPVSEPVEEPKEEPKAEESKEEPKTEPVSEAPKKEEPKVEPVVIASQIKKKPVVVSHPSLPQTHTIPTKLQERLEARQPQDISNLAKCPGWRW